MKRDDVLTILKEFKRDHAEEYGILKIGVFGSVARDEAGEDSDVDICIKTRPPNPADDFTDSPCGAGCENAAMVKLLRRRVTSRLQI
jgi:predicted nucleotidyltransferase